MSLQYGFRVASNTIAGITPEICEAIIAEYADEVMRCPCTADQWKAWLSVISLLLGGISSTQWGPLMGNMLS